MPSSTTQNSIRKSTRAHYPFCVCDPLFRLKCIAELRISIFVSRCWNADLPVQSTQQLHEWNIERPANSEQRFHRDGPSSLNLLPVTGREAEANHVFLRESLPISNVADTFTESAEECGVIDHALVLLRYEQKYHEQNSVASILIICWMLLRARRLEGRMF